MNKRLILKSSILAVVAGLSVATANSALADELAVQIMGVNDFHGALDATGTARLEGETVRNAGTAALLDSYMDSSQAEFEVEAATAEQPAESLRVQAGDMVGASPSNSGLLQDEPTIRVFNEMDFDYGTLGNHEFDEGLAEYNRIVTGEAPQPGQFNEIVDNYTHEAAKQEIVIANVIDKETGDIPYGWKPYAIKTIPVNDKTANIGFIGVVTTEIPNLVLKKNYEQYTFLDEAETIAKYAKELNDKGVHAIVVLAHVPSTSKDGIAEGDSANMIDKLDKLYPEHSVDLVFAGHNHVHTNGMAGKTLIVQATSQGKAYADVRGVIDTETGDFVSVPTAKIIAVAPGQKEPSPAIQAIVNEANTIVKQVTERKIATAKEATDISREVNDAKESPVGNLVTAGQLAIAKKSGYAVDFAMTNNGGIRADLKVNADHSITWGAAQAVQPFGNILQVVTLTGQQIYDVLNQQYDESENYFLQLSGIRYTYTDADQPTPEKPYKVVKAYKADGSEIDLNATYTVVINDFLFGGGDGFSVFKDAKLIGAINPDTEVFVEYLNDLEKSGQRIEALTTGTKTYVKASDLVTATPEENTPNTPNTTYNTEKTAPTSDTKTTDEQAADDSIRPLSATNKQESTQQEKPVATPSPKALPKTGEESLASVILMLLGGISLGLAGSVKRKTNH